MDNLLKAVGAFVLAFAVLVIAGIVRAFTIAIAWNWLAVPVFSVGALTIAQGFAVGILLSIAMWKKEQKDEDAGWKGLGRQMIQMIVQSLLFIGLAWIAKSLL